MNATVPVAALLRCAGLFETIRFFRAMARTPSGQCWCSLRIEGLYAGDMVNIRNTLTAYLDLDQAGDWKGAVLSPEKIPPFPTGSALLLQSSAAGPAEHE